MSEWTDHVDKWRNCTACPLCHQRDRICLARGQVPCDVLLVGEAPGASEDATGKPFDGPSGDLLQKIIDQVLPKDGTPSYALTNLVCCFPREAKGRGDNEPERDEILACRPRLYEFINLCSPRLIVCVGSLARDYVDHNNGVRCIDIVHPAAIVRMPLAQKNMAAQKCVVVLRNAVQNMVQSSSEFTKWETSDASVKKQKYLDSTIPF